jgi:hypothetical protein
MERSAAEVTAQSLRSRRHRFHLVRIRHEREMAGAAQADRTRRNASGSHSGSRHSGRDRPVGRNPDRGAVVWGGGNPGQRPRRRRDRARALWTTRGVAPRTPTLVPRAVCLTVKPVGEPEIGTSGSMSGDGRRSVAAWPKLSRPYSTLPSRQFPALYQR